MNILICDDSALARKSLARSLDRFSGLRLYFADNGKKAIERLQETDIDLLFLDLTMPVMDGFEVLDSLPVSSYQTKVVVISGDVQKESQKRCLALGAKDFIEKPFKADQIASVMNEYGLEGSFPGAEKVEFGQQITQADEINTDIDAVSKFKEITNIALGQSAAIISDCIGEFIQMPVPAVGVLEPGELKMTIEDAINRKDLHAVSQRFVGGGIHGEALVCMRGKGIATMGERLGFAQCESHDYETLLNVSNLLVSSYLNSLAHQLVMSFFLRQPMVLDKKSYENVNIQHIDKEAFAIEYTYFAEELDFECEVLFFLDSSSVNIVYQLMESF